MVRPFRTAFRVACVVTAVGLLANAPVQSDASEPESRDPAEATDMLERHMGFFVRDGGRWRAANPAYEPGSKAPKFYAYDFRWALGETLIQNTIHGVYEDDRRRDYAKTVFRWNPVIGKVEQYIFVNGGGTGYGVENRLDEITYEAEIEVRKTLHGPAERLKDWVKVTGPDSFDNSTFKLQLDGKWVLEPGSEVTYERVVP